MSTGSSRTLTNLPVLDFTFPNNSGLRFHLFRTILSDADWFFAEPQHGLAWIYLILSLFGLQGGAVAAGSGGEQIPHFHCLGNISS
jgi:hypothetical protein